MKFIEIPKRATDLTGQTFARLTVAGPVSHIRNEIKWLCRCECGGTAITTISRLRSGHTKSCGCLNAEKRRTNSLTHGKTYTRNYNIWRGMIARCTRPNEEAYPSYGGRGICIHDAWLNDFLAFEEYVSQLPNYDKPGRSLDRIDNDGNYEPGNLRWATQRDQSRNTRVNVMITYEGKTQCVQAWSEDTGIGRDTLRWRIRNGWSPERALTTPPWGRHMVRSAARWLDGQGQ